MSPEKIALLPFLLIGGFVFGRLLAQVLGVYFIARDITKQADPFLRRGTYYFWLYRAKSTGIYGRWWLKKHRERLIGDRHE